jgi:uncharacterized cysteine cluster protein YcgN (CxxCxxCC family)
VRRLARILLRLRVMLTEGLCDHCGHVLFAELRADATQLDYLYCVHCDRGHSRANCRQCDVMFATSSPELDGET